MRYNKRCKNCGYFLNKGNCNNPNCSNRVRKRFMFFGEERYKCGICFRYLSKKSFGYDKSKRFKIRYNCKECRRGIDMARRARKEKNIHLNSLNN